VRRAALLPVLVALVLAVTACSGVVGAEHTGTGNMADASPVAAPAHSRWFSGRLLVEPLGRGRACLLLVTPTRQLVLRPVSSRLTPVAWQVDGGFDATRSGIVRADGGLVAPYADERIWVRGGIEADADRECGTHPTLAFSKVSRKDMTPAPVVPSESSTVEPSPTVEPSRTASAGGVEPSIGLAPGEVATWKSGRLIVVPGNQGGRGCLALDTPEGAYTLTSASEDLDLVESVNEDGSFNQRETGVHIHGRNPLGMARTLGQHAELLGAVQAGTNFYCSAYPDFAVVDYR
jgi:hypothetical protein